LLDFHLTLTLTLTLILTMPKARTTPLTGVLRVAAPYSKLNPSVDNVDNEVNNREEAGFKPVLTKAQKKAAKKAWKKCEVLAKLALDVLESESMYCILKN
jgi:hypothetical protein